MTEEL